MNKNDQENHTEPLSLDACLELLANRQRREIIEFFMTADSDHASVEEIVSELISEEAAKMGELPGHDSITSTLFHIHLPKFAAAGILEYDSRNLEVRYHGDPRIESLYSKIEDH